jgi:acetylornithine deacetylase/succinyl-diaminopimelate desuccinylase-like protein
VPEALVRKQGMRSVVNLIVRHRFGDGGPTIALNAHGDVVPPGEGWTRPPYEGVVEDGRMYGRGVAVSKSDIATYTYALEALKAAERAGARLRGTVELHFHLRRGARRARGPGCCSSAGSRSPTTRSPASFSYAIVTAHNGALQLEVVVHGKAAHGAMPKTGVDALRAANAMIARSTPRRIGLERTKSSVPGIDSPTLIVGRIEGRHQHQRRADRVAFRLDRRHDPRGVAADVEARVRALIADAARAHPGVRVEIKAPAARQRAHAAPGHEKLVAALRRTASACSASRSRRSACRSTPTRGCTASAASRSSCTAPGPRTILEANAKRADENLKLDDMRRATKVVANAVADLLG